MYKWSDQDLLRVKRALSTFEKTSLPTTLGRALVMPGSPETEIEELISTGFSPALVHGIEERPEIAADLYSHYWDTSPIHGGTVGEWLPHCNGTFAYIHLDFCTHLKPKEIKAIEAAMGKLDAVSRLRISSYGSRKIESQELSELNLCEVTLCTLFDAAQRDGLLDSKTALKYYNDILSRVENDSTVALACLMYVNHVLGMAVAQLEEHWDTETTLPTSRGSLQVVNISKRKYVTQNHLMYTLWCDFAPAPCTTITNDPSWLVTNAIQFAKLVMEETTEFIPIGIGPANNG